MARYRTPVAISVTAAALLVLPIPVAVAVATPAPAATVFTVTQLADTADGVCDAQCTLRDAVAAAEAAPAGDTIRFAASLAGSQITLVLGQLEFTSAVRIDGATREVTINGGATSRIFDVQTAGRVELIGLRLTQGAGAGGGAIRNAGQLSVIGCLVEDNTSDGARDDDGGGIKNTESGVLTVVNSIFRGNSSGFSDGGSLGGGGISSAGELTVRASRITDNYSGGSGSGLSSTGTATIEDTVIDNNFQVVDGGGLANFGTMTLRHSTVRDNEAYDLGGGILNGGFTGVGTLIVESSTISGNVSDFYLGGGIYNGGGSTLELRNSTVTDNYASFFGETGGGLYNSGEATARNTLLAGNRANGLNQFTADCGGNPVTSEGGNVFGTGTGCAPGSSDRTVDPFEVATAVVLPLADYGGLTPTNALRWAGSNPALDIGGSCPAVDQRGLPAPLDGPDAGTVASCDAGSVEAGAPVNARVNVAAQDEIALVPFGGDNTLTVTIRARNVSGQPQTYDLWTTTTAPDGSVVATQVQRDITFEPEQSRQRAITAQLPGAAGLYRIDAFVGDYDSGVVVGSDALPVSKNGQA